MAKLEVNDIAELIADFDALGDAMDEAVEKMLDAEAQIVQEAQKKTARSMGVYDDSGKNVGVHVADSIQRGKTYKNSDGAATYVYPKGSRRRKNTSSSNSEIAFINEFGKRGQAPRPFIRTANETSAPAAAEAAGKVYDNFLKSKNL